MFATPASTRMPGYTGYLGNDSAPVGATGNKRKSHLLSLDPVDYKLHFGSNSLLAPRQPANSPSTVPASISRHSQNPFFRPPTPGGGPLSSHPTNPADFRGFPSIVEPPEKRLKRMASEDLTGDKENHPRTHNLGSSSTLSTAMPPPPAPTSSIQMSKVRRNAGMEKAHDRQPSSVRKLLSLRDLLSSFSSSRTSLHSTPGHRQFQDSDVTSGLAAGRPQSSSVSVSTTASTSMSAPVHILQQSGGSNAQDNADSVIHNSKRKKKHSSWFRRHSGLFVMNQDPNAVLEDAANQLKPNEGFAIRRVEHSPAPELPDIGSLAGGRLTDGKVGWEEGHFW